MTLRKIVIYPNSEIIFNRVDSSVDVVVKNIDTKEKHKLLFNEFNQAKEIGTGEFIYIFDDKFINLSGYIYFSDTLNKKEKIELLQNFLKSYGISKYKQISCNLIKEHDTDIPFKITLENIMNSLSSFFHNKVHKSNKSAYERGEIGINSNICNINPKYHNIINNRLTNYLNKYKIYDLLSINNIYYNPIVDQLNYTITFNRYSNCLYKNTAKHSNKVLLYIPLNSVLTKSQFNDLIKEYAKWSFANIYSRFIQLRKDSTNKYGLYVQYEFSHTKKHKKSDEEIIYNKIKNTLSKLKIKVDNYFTIQYQTINSSNSAISEIRKGLTFTNEHSQEYYYIFDLLSTGYITKFYLLSNYFFSDKFPLKEYYGKVYEHINLYENNQFSAILKVCDPKNRKATFPVYTYYKSSNLGELDKCG